MILGKNSGIQVSFYLVRKLLKPHITASYKGFEKIPDAYWHTNDSQSKHNFPIMNDRFTFVRYTKQNLKDMSHKRLCKRSNTTEKDVTSPIFYSSNNHCDSTKAFIVPECYYTTYLHGTDINNLQGHSSSHAAYESYNM